MHWKMYTSSPSLFVVCLAFSIGAVLPAGVTRGMASVEAEKRRIQRLERKAAWADKKVRQVTDRIIRIDGRIEALTEQQWQVEDKQVWLVDIALEADTKADRVEIVRAIKSRQRRIKRIEGDLDTVHKRMEKAEDYALYFEHTSTLAHARLRSARGLPPRERTPVRRPTVQRSAEPLTPRPETPPAPVLATLPKVVHKAPAEASPRPATVIDKSVVSNRPVEPVAGTKPKVTQTAKLIEVRNPVTVPQVLKKSAPVKPPQIVEKKPKAEGKPAVVKAPKAVGMPKVVLETAPAQPETPEANSTDAVGAAKVVVETPGIAALPKVVEQPEINIEPGKVLMPEMPDKPARIEQPAAAEVPQPQAKDPAVPEPAIPDGTAGTDTPKVLDIPKPAPEPPSVAEPLVVDIPPALEPPPAAEPEPEKKVPLQIAKATPKAKRPELEEPSTLPAEFDYIVIDRFRNMGTWAVDRFGSPADLSLEENKLNVTYNITDEPPKNKCVVSKHARMSIQGITALVIDIEHTSQQPATMALAIRSFDKVFYESEPVTLGEGLNRDILFDLMVPKFKSSDTNWAYNASLEDVNSILKIFFLIYAQGEGETSFTNLRIAERPELTDR